MDVCISIEVVEGRLKMKLESILKGFPYPTGAQKMIMGSGGYVGFPYPTGAQKAIIGSGGYVGEETTGLIPRSLTTEVNEYCPLKCTHCLVKSESHGEGNIELINERLSEVPDKGLAWASFALKEPLATPERLEHFLRTVQGKAYKSIVMTNLVLPTKEQIYRIGELADYLDVSLDGTEQVHDQVRGQGTFDRTTSNLRTALQSDLFEMVSLLTTVNALNVDELPRTLEYTAKEFTSKHENCHHAIWFYIGWPDNDEMVLSKNKMKEAAEYVSEFMSKKDARITFGVPVLYTPMIPEILSGFGVEDLSNMEYDGLTGIPFIRLDGENKIVPLGLIPPKKQHIVYLALDGKAYLGCSHLMLPKNNQRLAIGNLKEESIDTIFKRLENGERIFGGEPKLVELNKCAYSLDATMAEAYELSKEAA